MRLLGTIAAAAALAFAVAPAQAADTPCAQQIIDDWWADADIDGVYPVHCYREAIDALPEDLAAYSSAADDIQRALDALLRGETAPGETTPTDGGGNAGDGTTDTTGATGAGGTEGDASGSGGAQGEDGSPSSGGSATGTGAVAAPGDDLYGKGLGDAGGSLPLPLLVLLALGGLVAAGVAVRLLGQRLRRASEPGSGD